MSRVTAALRELELPDKTAADQAALFLPLLDDLVSAESHVEMRGPIGRAELAVAVRLSEERARLWNTNLWQILSAWKVGQPSAVTAGAAQGWAF